jgi:lipoprotein-anchoring transpeptidase ErfK/SrfK
VSKSSAKNFTMTTSKVIASVFMTVFPGSVPCQALADTSRFPTEFIRPEAPVRANISWYTPSDGPYPALSGDTDLWINASLSAQRIYIMDGRTILYTMITSSGFDSPDTYTPTGTYYIQNRGNWFYSAKYQEGAEFWVSWKGWGEYLFHSVPMNREQEVISSAATKLGTKASHGCFRLTIPDARWIYENIPEGTKVVIHN